jgi:O-methyltransferase
MSSATRLIGRLRGDSPGKAPPLRLPRDMQENEALRETIRAVEAYTMTSAHRLAAVVQAVEHIEKRKLPGAIVECGVWQGGSMMAAALTLCRLGAEDRELYLYDTFEGMAEPEDVDRNHEGSSAAQVLSEQLPSASSMADWCNAGLDEVRANMESTGYPSDRIHYVVGKVEDTIPATLPGPIALLRLDTDFYSSTRQELEHLYPLVPSGGIVILDDYGFWQGARQAVDEFLTDKPELFLNRIDAPGRLLIKP